MGGAISEVEQRSFLFGPFTLKPEQQMLLLGETVVRLGGRALELLTALVERPGQLMTKRELIKRAWPDTFVEESNLKVNMAALRKALGDETTAVRYIATVVGRGYRFVAPVRYASSASAVAAPQPPGRTSNLPRCATALVGQSATIEAIRGELNRTRLLTVTGAGGIGKTAVALAVAAQALPSIKDGVRFADLSRVGDPGSVPDAIAEAIGAPKPIGDILDGLCDHLRHRDLLLVLDGCEGIVGAVAACVDRLHAAAAALKILVTSREALRLRGERIFRHAALESPPPRAGLTAREALAYPAVALFVDRATAASRSFRLTDDEAGDLAEICRRLDGLPLAIEIAATHIDAFGMRDLLGLVREKAGTLGGLRVDHERHRSLHATIGWSYRLLSGSEQRLLLRLATLPDSFSLSAACAIGARGGIHRGAVVEDLANLVAKSLILADTRGAPTLYSQMTTIRAFVLEQRVDSGEPDDTGLCHAHDPAPDRIPDGERWAE